MKHGELEAVIGDALSKLMTDEPLIDDDACELLIDRVAWPDPSATFDNPSDLGTPFEPQPRTGLAALATAGLLAAGLLGWFVAQTPAIEVAEPLTVAAPRPTIPAPIKPSFRSNVDARLDLLFDLSTKAIVSRDSANSITVDLSEGRILIRVKEAKPPLTLTVHAPNQTLRTTAAVFRVEVASGNDAELRLDVHEGEVSTESVPAGGADQPSKSRHSRSPRRPAASAMLARARRLLRERRSDDAAREYRRVLSTYPNTQESKAATVALADVYLHRLSRPRDAERLLRTYLDSALSGPLALEARIGLVEALRQQGRRDEEARAIEAFLAHHPHVGHASNLRRRLESLQRH